jgi:hypothetical protein
MVLLFDHLSGADPFNRKTVGTSALPRVYLPYICRISAVYPVYADIGRVYRRYWPGIATVYGRLDTRGSGDPYCREAVENDPVAQIKKVSSHKTKWDRRLQGSPQLERKFANTAASGELI